ncbi:DeoR/GlpR family DNA-binding transcription regulator [Gammaproteobacteria bacterium]|nr:DeoR/GlpR family DNA-binding transcription regulator [Gammaproteobacteria bacterium]
MNSWATCFERFEFVAEYGSCHINDNTGTTGAILLMSIEKLPKHARHQRLIDEINHRPGVLIRDLADMFSVSRETIRRDFDELSSEGRLNRRYGGASISPTGLVTSLETRKQLQRPEKEAIAQATCKLITDHEVLMLGSGATIIILAQELARQNRSLTVITHSLGVALTLGPAKDIRVLLAPGELDYAEAFMWGHETTDFLAKFTVDTSLFSCDGVTAQGVMEVDSRTAWIERAMVANSRRKILLMDHTKYNKTSLEKVCSLADVDSMVCDDPPDGELASMLERENVAIYASGPAISTVEKLASN